MKILLAIALMLMMPVAALAEPPSFAESCKAWLALIDAGKYDESWDTGSAYLKSKLDKATWSTLVKGGRDMVGPVISRGSAQVTPTDTLPDAPFGRYLVITIPAKFQMAPSATETIILKLENGEWKGAGYFIK